MRSRLTQFAALTSLVLVLLGQATAVRAQQLTGSIEGTIADSSGGLLPGVTLTLTNTATGIALSQTSDAKGHYWFAAVKPGSYVLRASLDGFKGASRPVTAELNATSKANLTMSVGSISEVVEVTAATPNVNVTRAQVATNIDAKLIVDLPNLNRDITALVELVPGARQVQGTTSSGSQVIDISGNYALGNGTRRSQSVFYLDGSENMGSRRNQALQMPNPDTVEEVQVVSSSASAEFGKEPGISLNAITKSGTNVLHGTAFFSTHNARFNANTWAANRAGSPKPKDDQKWMGATVGGPIRKNQTFFFVSFQRYKDNQAAQVTNVRMPTPQMMNGDFSAIPGFSIFATNPATGQPIGSLIPASLINPLAAKLKSRFPTIEAYNNSLRQYWTFEREVQNNEYLAKIDHRFSDRHQVALSYMTTKGDQNRPDNVAGLENNVPGWGGTSVVDARQHTASLRHTWIKSPTVVIENRLAMGRLASGRVRTELGENLGTLGVPWPTVTAGVEKTLPSIFFSGGPSGRGGQLSDTIQQNYRALSTLSWNRGSHRFKFGAEAQYQGFSRFLNYDNGQLFFTGSYSFTAGPINGPWPTLRNPSGDLTFAYAWADFLLGRLSRVVATGVSDNEIHGGAAFFFAQDEWRVTPRLTISPGLRYELYGSLSSRALLAGFADGHQSDQYQNAPIGLAFEGDRGIPKAFQKPDRNNIGPRLGVAYDVRGDGKLALRAGGGVYYAYPALAVLEVLSDTVGAPTITGNNASLTDPWATARANSGDTACQFPGCTAPSFSSDPAKRTFVPTTITGFDPKLDTPYQYQFNLSAQWEPLRGLALEGAYVGNRARHGFFVADANLPVYSATQTEGNVNARRPNQLFRAIQLVSTTSKENYDAGQFTATFRRRTTYARLSYTLQRSLSTGDAEGQEVGISNTPAAWADNPRNIDGEIAPSTPLQVLRGHLAVELPHLSPLRLDRILGGWQIGGDFTWTDGDRLNVTLGAENNFDGISGDRPDQVGSINYIRRQEGDVTTWIDRSAFVAPPAATAQNPYPFGNLPRNAVRGPSSFFANAVLMKNFPISGRVRFQLRADAQNILNHPNLSNPNMSLASADFGLIRTKTGGGRTMQIQGKVIF